MEEEKSTVEQSCRVCGKVVRLEVVKKDWDAWRAGVLIQRAMPYLTKDQRELLISGICGECFDAMFEEEDE